MRSSTYSPHINYSGQDSLTRVFFRAPIFRSRLEARSNKKAIKYQSGQYKMQTADCRPGTKRRLGTKCRLQIGCKMQTENLYCFFVWYVISCHLATFRASRNRFSAIIFHDYLHYCGIFLARFLITIVLNIISNLHIVFFLCARVGWCDVGSEFTNLMKVDVDVNEMLLLNI